MEALERALANGSDAVDLSAGDLSDYLKSFADVPQELADLANAELELRVLAPVEKLRALHERTMERFGKPDVVDPAIVRDLPKAADGDDGRPTRPKPNKRANRTTDGSE